MSSFQLCSKISDKDFLESTFPTFEKVEPNDETKDAIDGSDVIPYDGSFGSTFSKVENEVEVYVSRHDFRLNLEMLNYGIEDKGFKMDWSKLCYGDEQMAEHLLNKIEERMPPQRYNYLFTKPHKRTIQEKFYLKEAGISFNELEDLTDEMGNLNFDEKCEIRLVPEYIARY